MKVSTGSPVLDEVVGGGLPACRAILLTGGPATGKTTLAMQFLQAGLDAGEQCLFISTEQTTAELRDAFADFTFDLDHGNLTITTIHPVPGETLRQGDAELTIKTLQGGELLDTGTGIPFERQYLRDVLEQYAPVDRIVLDSTSGLAALGDDDVFRRAIHDLIRLFSDEFEATSVLIAEGHPGAPETVTGHDLLQFTAHGVIRLWRADHEGTQYRYLRVDKLRGTDHDTRRYVITIDTDGVRLSPRQRTCPCGLGTCEFFATEIAGLDALLGGGLIEGSSVLYLHDGRADRYAVLSQIMATAMAADWIVGLTPPAGLTLARLDDFWTAESITVRDALDANRLLVEEFVRPPSDRHDNVLNYEAYDDLETFLEAVYTRTAGHQFLPVVDLEPILQRVSPERVKEGRYRVTSNLMSETHIPLYVLNPATVPDQFASFLIDASQQVLRHSQDEDGLEYLKLVKAPVGSPGAGRVVEYTAESPYVRVV